MGMNATNGQTGEEMDAAAREALEELRQTLSQETLQQVADWWERWYLKAGHKRLGRALLGKL